LVRGFYALKDTKTPVLVSLASISLNILLSAVFVLVLGFGVWGVGLAYSISIIIGTIFLTFFLSKKIHGFDNSDLVTPAVKMLVAAGAAAFALYIPMKSLDQLVFDTTKTVNLIMLTGIASSFGLAIYVLLVWLMEVKELTTFIQLIKKIGRVKISLESEELPKDTGSFS
jgi:putative peptidoglycan lipid II flippase